MSSNGLKTNTGTASWANRNHYGIRRITTGEILPIARPFGSITAAIDYLDAAHMDLDDYETIDLHRNADAVAELRALGTKGLPR